MAIWTCLLAMQWIPTFGQAVPGSGLVVPIPFLSISSQRPVSSRFWKKGRNTTWTGCSMREIPCLIFSGCTKSPFCRGEYSLLLLKFVPYKPEILEINGQRGEAAEITWAAFFQDVNADGFPDLWVGNDMGYLRLYLNREGRQFEPVEHARSHASGNWMSFAPGDFNNDLREDVFAGNMGGAVFNMAFSLPQPMALFEPTINLGTIAQEFVTGKHDVKHAIINGAAVRSEFSTRVFHSRVLPPDSSLPGNIRPVGFGRSLPDPPRPDSLDPYEFSWGSAAFDVQNDGLLDLYYLGCIMTRGGGLFTITGTGPGRLLVNTTGKQDALRFADLTAEHHLFNMHELKYDRLESEGYVYRRAPRQNWGKRDQVRSYDRSIWTVTGPDQIERITNHDLIQTAENGRSVVATDLNNDGFSDLIMRNVGGYDSRSSKATNLKAMIDGRPQVVPAHSYHYPSPTNYEPGSSRLFVNTYNSGNWLKVRLIQDGSENFNRDAVGAVVTVNDEVVRVRRVGDGSFQSNVYADLHFGLGNDSASMIRVRWPNREQSETVVHVNALKNGIATISQSAGLVRFQ